MKRKEAAALSETRQTHRIESRAFQTESLHINDAATPQSNLDAAALLHQSVLRVPLCDKSCPVYQNKLLEHFGLKKPNGDFRVALV